MSLYEPSVRSSTWSLSQRFSRPLTTLEGWREISSGVYAMNSDVRMISKREQFDPEQYRNKQDARSVHSKSQEENEPRIPAIPNIPKAYSVKSYAQTEAQPEDAVAMEFRMPGHLRTVEVKPDQEKERIVTSIRIPQPKYHVFSYRTKWMIVGIITVVGMFPGLALGMYLPLLVTIATEVNCSVRGITLTVSSYLVMHGLAGLVWSPLSDHVGRRPIILASLLAFIGASVPLILPPSYPVLLALRGVQAGSIASVSAIGSSVIKDIAQDSDRETFMNFYHYAHSVAIVLAPIIGGTLSNFVYFRAMFIFLLSIAIAMLVIVGLFLPETLRCIAGNGSVKPDGIHKPIVYRPPHVRKSSNVALPPPADEKPGLGARAFLEPFLLVREKDILINLLSGAVIFTMWMMVTVSSTGLFEKTFGLNNLQLGLSFIPNALGVVAGSTAMKKVLDRDIMFAFSRYKAENTLPPAAKLCMKTLAADFPLEHTRLRRLPWIAVCFTFSLSAYGFTLAYRNATVRPGWIAVPMTVQFIIAATAHARCTVHQTLVTDLWHQNENASIVACNLFKLLFSAGGVALVQTLLDSLRAWSTFLTLGLAVMVVVPLPIIQWYWGREWRAERETKRAIIERFTKA